MCCLSQGGDEIDDVFGCIIMNTNGEIKVAPLDTYNIRGRNKLNLGDGGLVSSAILRNMILILHE